MPLKVLLLTIPGNLTSTQLKCIVMNKSQVFDLGEEAPDSVLRRLFLNLEKLKLSGDEFADKIEEKLRIIVS